MCNTTGEATATGAICFKIFLPSTGLNASAPDDKRTSNAERAAVTATNVEVGRVMLFSLRNCALCSFLAGQTRYRDAAVRYFFGLGLAIRAKTGGTRAALSKEPVVNEVEVNEELLVCASSFPPGADLIQSRKERGTNKTKRKACFPNKAAPLPWSLVGLSPCSAHHRPFTISNVAIQTEYGAHASSAQGVERWR